MNFKQWFLENQMKLFSTSQVELYHGSNTGADNSVLNSFVRNGINPSIAQGYGQGAGFYVWSDKNSAINHTKAIEKDSITSLAKKDGVPMVVTIEAMVEPEKWDLDYEVNKKQIINWLHDNFEKLQPPLSQQDNVLLLRKYNREILDPNDKFVMSKGVQISTESRTSLYAQSDSNIRAGEVLGAVLNKLQQKDPQTVYKFEELLFANMRPGFALKYVGNEPLKPKRIEILKNNSWVNIKLS